jgi:hypothetical protein
MSLSTEQAYPYLAGIAAGILYFFVGKMCSIPDTLHQLFAAVISIAAIAVGFLATAKALLITISEDRPLIQKLNAIGYYDRFHHYLDAGIGWSFALSIFSAVGLLISFKSEELWHFALLSAWVGLATTTILLYVRVVRILNRLLTA